MKIPDILAMELDDAIDCCIEAGIEAEISFTQAPGNTSQGRLRVLRIQGTTNGKILLTVARE